MVLISCLISGRPGIFVDGPSLPGDIARDLGEEPGDGLLEVGGPDEALGDGLLSVGGPGEALGDGLLSFGDLTRSLLSKRGFLLGVSDQSELTARLS